jgi:hypothetical protein
MLQHFLKNLGQQKMMLLFFLIDPMHWKVAMGSQNLLSQNYECDDPDIELLSLHPE